MTTRVIFNKNKDDNKKAMAMAYAIVIEETKPGTKRCTLTTKSKSTNSGDAKKNIADRISTLNIAHIIMPSEKQVYATMRLNEVRILFRNIL